MITILLSTNFGKQNPALAISIGLLCDVLIALTLANFFKNI
jgi:hypothetical protein